MSKNVMVSMRRMYGLLVAAFGLGTIAGGVGGVLLFINVAGGSGEASAPISAPTLAVNIATPTPEAVVVSANATVFRIVPEESEARYIVDELDPFVTGLVGSTDQVAGDILVDFENPANSQVGMVRINLRTLRTDNANRDRAVRAEVLLSAQPEYEFTEFTPTSISGLPGQVTMGEPMTFQVTGDLPLAGVTRSITFDVTLTPLSETELNGLATTTVLREDYGLLQGFLADRGVSEAVILELEFVARAVDG